MGKLKIKLIRSKAGRQEKQIKTIEALGLRKIGDCVLREDNEAVRGMIRKVDFMLDVEEVN
ncbi:MAG: 50S ribosomal protein L30 [Tissierellia bacterium]|nr:50S ribosomal protein L30 [Tissierellia bacterium]